MVALLGGTRKHALASPRRDGERKGLASVPGPTVDNLGIDQMGRVHRENHLVERIGWLRAAVLGANDGIISTASLILGVAAAAAAKSDILLAGIAGLVAGAMSMAAGEYVSVSSQSDTEQADLARERLELSKDPEFEKEELAQIYVARGVEPQLAREVALQLMVKDALGAHARDELGFSEITTARPTQAAVTSAATFCSDWSSGTTCPRPALTINPTDAHRLSGIAAVPGVLGSSAPRPAALKS